MSIWYAVVAAVMTPSEAATAILGAARLVFDYSEAQKNREERKQQAKTDERIRELERQVAELSAKKSSRRKA